MKQTWTDKKKQNEFATYNFKGANQDDIDGLVGRNEELENELRLIVQTYLQGIVIQMALARKTLQSFNQLYDPNQKSKELNFSNNLDI